MADPTMLSEFPDAAQRRAVCERQATAGKPRQSQAQAGGPVNFTSEPGALTIEAGADAGADGTSKLPRFSMVAYTGGPMRIAGWRYPVVVDLAGLSIPSQSRPIRFGHDMASGVGHTDSIAVADGRLVAAGIVSRDTAAAKEIVASARNGFPWQASLGAAVEQFEFVKEDQSVQVNGREFKGPVNVVRKAALGEISFVDLGADGNTTASVAAAAKEKSIMSETQVTQEQGKVQAAAQVDTADKDGGAVADPVLDIRAKALAETKRIEAVRKVCAGKHPDIEAKAIEEGWDVKDTELAVLRAGRPKPPDVGTGEPPADGKVLAAAVCLVGGLAPDSYVSALP
jgi:hypothetical protein